MKLTEAVRVLLYTRVRGHKLCNEATATIKQQLDKIGHRLKSFKMSLGEDAVEDAIQTVILNTLRREAPLQGEPPGSEDEANGFLYRCLWNVLVSEYRKRARRKEIALSLQGEASLGPMDLEAPSACPPTAPHRLERIGPGDLDPEKSVLETLEALACWKMQAADQFLARANISTDAKDDWPLFQDATLAAFRHLRSRADRERFAVSFRRLVRVFFGLTSMEKEVEELLAERSTGSPKTPQGQRKVRNTLDKQNSRTLERIYLAMIKQGVPEGRAREFVSALALRAYRRNSDREEEQ